MNNPIMIGRKELPHVFLSTMMGAQEDSPQVICGWCGTELRPGALPASHGICHGCLAEQRQELAKLKAAGLTPLVAVGS